MRRKSVCFIYCSYCNGSKDLSLAEISIDPRIGVWWGYGGFAPPPCCDLCRRCMEKGACLECSYRVRSNQRKDCNEGYGEIRCYYLFIIVSLRFF